MTDNRPYEVVARHDRTESLHHAADIESRLEQELTDRQYQFASALPRIELWTVGQLLLQPRLDVRGVVQ